MKKIISIFLTICFMFALLLNFSNIDPDKKWSFRGYVTYVSENIEPFPTADLGSINPDSALAEKISSSVGLVFKLMLYPLKVVRVCVYNAGVILNGLFPIQWDKDNVDFEPGPGDWDGNGDGNPDSGGDEYEEPPEEPSDSDSSEG